MTRRALLVAAALPQRPWIMPAESAPHKRTWMAFGAHQNIWGAKLLPEVERNLIAIAQAVAKFEAVSILIPAVSAPSTNPQIEFVVTPLDDLWIRDTGPVFVRGEQGQRSVIDLNFDVWGDKQAHDRDATVATIVARKAALRRMETGLILEGGGIEVDGAGTAIITESSVLNRNPDVPRAEIDREIGTLLGLDKKWKMARLGNLRAVLVSSESLGAEAVEFAAGGVKRPLLFLRVAMIEEWPVILY